MGGFTPFKKHANSFKYTPRYYDPIKESLEQRRAELNGQRRDMPKDENGKPIYVPGDYIRNKRASRTINGRGQKEDGRKSTLMMVAVVLIVFMVGWVFAQQLAEVFTTATTNPQDKVTTDTFEEFDPYAPITVVPNDYDPSKEVAK